MCGVLQTLLPSPLSPLPPPCGSSTAQAPDVGNKYYGDHLLNKNQPVFGTLTVCFCQTLMCLQSVSLVVGAGVGRLCN